MNSSWAAFLVVIGEYHKGGAGKDGEWSIVVAKGLLSGTEGKEETNVEKFCNCLFLGAAIMWAVLELLKERNRDWVDSGWRRSTPRVDIPDQGQSAPGGPVRGDCVTLW